MKKASIWINSVLWNGDGPLDITAYHLDGLRGRLRIKCWPTSFYKDIFKEISTALTNNAYIKVSVHGFLELIVNKIEVPDNEMVMVVEGEYKLISNGLERAANQVKQKHGAISHFKTEQEDK